MGECMCIVHLVNQLPRSIEHMLLIGNPMCATLFIDTFKTRYVKNLFQNYNAHN
jgi:hypothetical protein